MPSGDDRETEASLEKNKEEARGDHVHSLFFHSSPFNGFPCTPFSSNIRCSTRRAFFLRTLSLLHCRRQLSPSLRQVEAPPYPRSPSPSLLLPANFCLLTNPDTRTLLSLLPPFRALLPPNLSRISDATMRDGGQKLRRVESGSRPIIRKISPSSLFLDSSHTFPFFFFFILCNFRFSSFLGR